MGQLNKFAMVSLILLSAKAWALSGSSNFLEATKLWQQSRDVASSEINGSWMQTAVFEHKDCQNVMKGSAFDAKGIKNSDGSVFTIFFEGHQVTFKNVGDLGRTQGPYEIQDRNAEFSSWAYDDGGGKHKVMTDQAYGFYRCRVLADSKDQLLCAVGARLRPGALSDEVFKVCSSHDTGLMVLFSKLHN